MAENSTQKLARQNWDGLSPQKRKEVLVNLKKVQAHRLSAWGPEAECLQDLTTLEFEELPKHIRISLEYSIYGATFSAKTYLKRAIAA